jgi:hypothetical protein
MHTVDEPADLTSDTGLTELAFLFALAIVRLQKQGLLRDSIKREPTSTSAACLEVRRETVLSVVRG